MEVTSEKWEVQSESVKWQVESRKHKLESVSDSDWLPVPATQAVPRDAGQKRVGIVITPNNFGSST